MFEYHQNDEELCWISKRTIHHSAIHWHSFYEVELLLDGEAVETINGAPHTIKRGSLTVMPSGSFHGYRSVGSAICLYTFCFQKSLLSSKMRNWLDRSRLPWLFALNTEQTEETVHWFAALEKALASNSQEHDAVVQRIVELILLQCPSETENLADDHGEPSDCQMQLVRTALSYVDEHYAEKINRDALAEPLHYSASHFSVLFHRLAGVTLSQYIASVRMSRAMDLLCNSELPISTIIKEVGYTSESLFYRTFHAHFHVNPYSVRANRKELP